MNSVELNLDPAVSENAVAAAPFCGASMEYFNPCSSFNNEIRSEFVAILIKIFTFHFTVDFLRPLPFLHHVLFLAMTSHRQD